jgi:antitoxin component of RelBE/YafQ-DinJ toxin-antitoxin module
MLDQARIVVKSAHRTAMILPLAGFTTSQGVATSLKRLADIAGMPFTLHIESESYVDVDTLPAVVDDGTLLALTYAIVRANPADDTSTCVVCSKACRHRKSCPAWASSSCICVTLGRVEDGIGLHRAGRGDGAFTCGESGGNGGGATHPRPLSAARNLAR